MTELRIVTFGQPQPKGSTRMVGRTKNGVAILVNDCEGYAQWHANVKASGIECMNRNRMKPLDGPLLGRFVFTMRKPKNAPKKRRTWPDKKPDLDKLARAVCDALEDGGVLVNDSRIVEFSRLVKVFPAEDPEALIQPGVVVTIRPLIG